MTLYVGKNKRKEKKINATEKGKKKILTNVNSCSLSTMGRPEALKYYFYYNAMLNLTIFYDNGGVCRKGKSG